MSSGNGREAAQRPVAAGRKSHFGDKKVKKFSILNEVFQNITVFVTGVWYKGYKKTMFLSSERKGGSEMTGKAWGNEYRTTIVCIDPYEDQKLNGRFYNPYLRSGKKFHSLVQFIKEMEQTLNTMGFPQSYNAVRNFADPPELSNGPPEEEILTGTKATFALRILFRQNASWQGSVTWLEGKKEQSFRSLLELVLLMDSAISQP